MKRYAVSAHNYHSPVIEAGKRYEVFDWDMEDDADIAFFSIFTVDDYGETYKAHCIAFQGCAYLDDEQWTIIEEGEPSDG